MEIEIPLLNIQNFIFIIKIKFIKAVGAHNLKYWQFIVYYTIMNVSM